MVYPIKFLLTPGTSSTVGSIQTLALTTIAKLVTSAGSQQIRPHIPELVPSMLESLSSMEVSFNLISLLKFLYGFMIEIRLFCG